MNRERKKQAEGNSRRREKKKKMEKINFLILFVLDLLSHPIGSGNEGEWDDDSRYGEESSVKILNSCTHPRLFSIIDDCGNDFDFHFDTSHPATAKNVRAVDFDPTSSSRLCVVWDICMASLCEWNWNPAMWKCIQIHLKLLSMISIAPSWLDEIPVDKYSTAIGGREKQ